MFENVTFGTLAGWGNSAVSYGKESMTMPVWVYMLIVIVAVWIFRK